MKILLIEDDIEISEMLCSYLIAENFEVVCATDGQKACEAFDIGSYSIVLLDLMIPKITGMNVMKYIRQKSTVPIIIISAKDSDSDKTLGLGLGADDYITKPFSITEVMARIKANIRRNTEYAAVQPEQTKLDAVKVYVSKIRSAIEPFPEIDIATVRGIGYRGIKNE